MNTIAQRRTILYCIQMYLTYNSPAAYEGIVNGTSQCCRVGSKSLCLCGHHLSIHLAVNVPKSASYIKPPSCQKCRCGGFAYCPARPEECGQWWLPRRKEFTIPEWQEVIHCS